MKKILFLCVLAAMFAMPGMLFAGETVSASRVDAYCVRRLLAKHFDNIRIDGDAVIVKTDDTNVRLSILPKIKTIRVSVGFSSYDKISRAEMIIYANRFNYEKRFVRIAVAPNDNSTDVDLYMFYDGGLSEENLKEAVRVVAFMSDAWAEYVLNGGRDKED